MSERAMQSWRVVERALLGVRAGLGGALMGLANLVPGISGATMLLAAGVYPQFVSGVAELSRGRVARGPVVVVATVAVSALLAVVLAAATVRDLVVQERWMMYSLFVGLTLGGVPMLKRMIGPMSRRVWAGAGAGLVLMGLIVWVQALELGVGGAEAGGGWGWMFAAGLIGAAAMILPGVSGGYLLLVLGLYVPVLSAVAGIRAATGERDWALLGELGYTAVLPIGLGVVAGVVAVSQVLRWLLERHRALTLGVLLGLLVGAVLGLWPFQESVEPSPGDMVRGQVLSEQEVQAMEPEDWPTAFFEPTAGQIGASLVLIAAGFGVTSGVARLTRGLDRKPGRDAARTSAQRSCV